MGPDRRVLPTQGRVKNWRVKLLTDDFYGIAFQAGKGYDFSSMQINAFIWQHGANIWDETQAPDSQAGGVVVNSPRSRQGVWEHYLSFIDYMPPVAKTGSDGHLRDPGPLHARQGRCDHRLGWPGRASTRPELHPQFHDKSAFAPAPGLQQGDDGSIDRTGNIGGQPFVSNNVELATTSSRKR